jgi:TolB-like protein
MVVGTIGNINNVESSSTLGRTITEQVSARLAERGYNIAEMKMRQGINIQEGGFDSSAPGEYLLSSDVRNNSGEHKAAAAVTGTYSIADSVVLVNLRLLDVRTGNIITAYDYTLPKTSDVLVMSGGSLDKDTYFDSAWRD